MNRKAYVIFVSVIAAIGGLLFGFDTAIIAGATRFLKDQFALSSFGEGLAVSIVLVGCMAGTWIAGPASDRLGRKPLLLTACGGMGVSFILLGAAFKFQLFSGGLVLVFTLL